MELGMYGLGRMGGNMARRLVRGGHSVVVYNRDLAKVDELKKVGARGATSLKELVSSLKKPRHVWVMLPAGDVTEKAIEELGTLLEPGDCVIDGGNTMFKDDVRRGHVLEKKGIHYVDVGTSGGVWGLERGYCLMIGGKSEPVKRLDSVFATLAPGVGDVEPTEGRKGGSAEQGYLHCGPVGAGHFVKMIHNGIEYGIMQAYAEGLDILKNANSPNLPADQRYDLQLADVTELWRRGSVVGSWLLDLTARALTQDPSLAKFEGVVQDSGEGRWTIQAAIDEAVPCDVLAAALFVRFRSRQQHTFAEKALSAMRHQFGGHVEPAKVK
ncbi:MAG: decarboxylating 6-phosphogluconate dehydrogenase [Planctomycetes bacterium]|nr:decarboxylating 6-phosphogluconate dehydrogenase [Planctomycetota bacterium]